MHHSETGFTPRAVVVFQVKSILDYAINLSPTLFVGFFVSATEYAQVIVNIPFEQTRMLLQIVVDNKNRE